MSPSMIEPLPTLSDLFSNCLSAGHKIQKRFWFFNDQIAPSLNLPRYKNLYAYICKQYPKLLPLEIKKFIKKFKYLQNMQPVVGIIPVTADGKKILLVKNYTSKCWSFPKGKLEAGELEVMGAIRECHEEIGYKINQDDIIDRLEFKGYNRNGTFFLVKNMPETYNYHAQNTFEIRDIKWHPIDNTLKTRDYNIFINRLADQILTKLN